MKNGYRKIVTPLYLINIAVQSLVSLVSPIVLMYFVGVLITKYTSVGGWIYVVLIMLGVFSGLYSMITFILGATRALEAIEKQHREDEERKDDSHRKI